MLIVSQNGNAVILSEKLYGIAIGGRGNDYKITATTGKYRDTMAIYETEKAAQNAFEMFMQALVADKERFEFPGDFE